MTKAKPIAFSGPMVRAILKGRKTQTRRILKPHPFDPSFNGLVSAARELVRSLHEPGDLLYVKEAWRAHGQWDAVPPRKIPPGSPVQHLADEPLSPWDSRYRHARFMPEWASRITLRVTEVRVQRLQQITRKDAIAEGAKQVSPVLWSMDGEVTESQHLTPRTAFIEYWNRLHAPAHCFDPVSWENNPWVAAYTFERIDQHEPRARA